MPGAREYAESLMRQFLAGGNFVNAGPVAAGALVNIAPAHSGVSIAAEFERDEVVTNLPVQAVAFSSDDERVFVYVTKGPRRRELELRTSATNDGVPLTIARVGNVSVRPAQSAKMRARGGVFLKGKRVACGSSIAPAGEAYAGTFGALVRRSGSGDLFMLSNNHVLGGCNHTEVGQPILAPSPIDATPSTPAPRAVATHADICELRSGVPGLVTPGLADLALARVTDPDLVSSWQGDENGCDTPSSVIAPSSYLRVKKAGRTTGLTSGVVEARALQFALPYAARRFGATVWFDGAWTVRGDEGEPFAAPGDSGSLVVTEDGAHAVGIIFAVSTNGDLAYMLPMPHVAGCFGALALVSKHGV